MSQSYFPLSLSRSMPLPAAEAPEEHSTHSHAEDVKEAYIAKKDRLLNAIDETQVVLSDLRKFNKEEWVVRYPQVLEQPSASGSSTTPRHKAIRRSLSFQDEPSFQADVIVSPSAKGMARSISLASISDVESEETEEPEQEEDEAPTAVDEIPDFNVFRLDLKLGAHGSSSSPAALVSQLEKNSIANLLDERISSSMEHINKLRSRVEDTSSKVLVTGDLNAGKSTFVNALLRREVMPIDQQPCTTAFCEVHDAMAENGGKEEVHILKEGIPYSIIDDSTFTRAGLTDLEDIMSENENVQQVMKVYLKDAREPEQSLLSNGLVDISLIDAPGLNRDIFKTTAVFARQEEIDVIVYVVSAENHFTLSAKEFLTTAAKEKAYIFIVVNKYEGIRDKAKCKRLVLEQIRQLSPRTYEDAEDLVHFVDASAALQNGTPAFEELEESLRSFVLVKRSKSKLMPVSTYLANILSDVDFLVGANAILAQVELDRAKEDLKRARPVLEKMQDCCGSLSNSLENLEEDTTARSQKMTTELLTEALERVGQGKLGADSTQITLPSFPGFMGIWNYAKDVRRALLASLDLAVKLAEDQARTITTDAVNQVSKLADEHLPEGVERSRRVFMPEAMFSARAGAKGLRRKSSRLSSSAVVAGGLHGLGLGLAQRSDMLETTVLDIFDAQYHFHLHFGDGKEDEDASVSALGMFSVGLGALTMVGTKAVGFPAIIEGFIRLSEMLGNESSRKWAAPLIGAAVIGAGAYLVLELPNTIPRTVGRRIKASLVKEGELKGDDASFVSVHSVRVGRETRKVLRLASWDLKERFRTAMEERLREVKGAEDMEHKAKTAVEWFRGVEHKTSEVRVLAGL
ncbi:hypothetical protein CERSUDRAFT_81034 [Gelatoporia subvermispora B]|uniref:Dynamin-type G domain-containing protein n=1 Tax=Ceriporiopsis subvermispora (strain B) TaxID=914234 RepID=M2RMF6_CERS8|nr:hypothetical protein CERSUDRAFT_81034 [Gelatoporia subvermispora B]